MSCVNRNHKKYGIELAKAQFLKDLKSDKEYVLSVKYAHSIGMNIPITGFKMSVIELFIPSCETIISVYCSTGNTH